VAPQVRDNCTIVVTHYRSFGNWYGYVFARLAMASFTHAVGTVAGTAVRMVAKGVQRRDVAIRYQPDVAPIATVSAVGTAFGYMGFTAERHRSRASVTAFDMNLSFIDEGCH
jgi:hypothetical protein